MNQTNFSFRAYGWLFLSTGIFAMVGALFTWGTGWLFARHDLSESIIPVADLLIAGPLSILAGIGLFNAKRWGIILGIACSGIYIYGSIQVYFLLIRNGPPYPWQLLLPPIFGIGIATSFMYLIYKRMPL